MNETTAEATVVGDQVTRVELAIEQHEAPALGTLGMELEVQLDDARVKSVTAGGPAARAGIVVGDVVVKLGDLSAKDDPVYRLVAQLDSVFAGKPITLVLERGDNTITVSIVPEPRE